MHGACVCSISHIFTEPSTKASRLGMDTSSGELGKAYRQKVMQPVSVKCCLLQVALFFMNQKIKIVSANFFSPREDPNMLKNQNKQFLLPFSQEFCKRLLLYCLSRGYCLFKGKYHCHSELSHLTFKALRSISCWLYSQNIQPFWFPKPYITRIHLTHEGSLVLSPSVSTPPFFLQAVPQHCF